MKVLEIVHSMDANGERITTVPLINSDKTVTLYEKDLDYLISLGVPLVWRLVQERVCLRDTKKTSVARVLVQAKKEDRVQFKDKCSTNLRRDNIILTTEQDKANARKEPVHVTHVLNY